MPLGHGFHALPEGSVAAVVTYLEMRAKPRRKPVTPGGVPVLLRLVEKPQAEWYRALYRRVGADWLWFSRLVMPDAALETTIHDRNVEIYAVEAMGRREIGLVELDFREKGQCEIAFFGLVREALSQGIGKRLMDMTLAKAWRDGVERVWVHTCTLDHSKALVFYVGCGFVPYRRDIEIAPDPRLSDILPVEAAAAHHPILRP
jgi:GNAT superfamily N-acetyltransferase